MQVVQFIDAYNDKKSNTNLFFFEENKLYYSHHIVLFYGFYYHTEKILHTQSNNLVRTSSIDVVPCKACWFCYLSRTAWVVSAIAPARGACWQLLQVQVFGELYDRMFAGGGGGGLAAGPLIAFERPRRRQHRQQHQHCHNQWQNEPAHRGHLRKDRPPLAAAPIPATQ